MVCRRNETTCIVGGSGAGKTTLLRLIVALEKPTSGHIFIDGEDIVAMGERELNRVRQKFGMVYQYAALLDSITVLDNVAFPLVEHTKLSQQEIRANGHRQARDPRPRRERPRRSSRRSSRAACASASASRARSCSSPPILVYDEPTSGLDPLTSRAVDDLIDETRQRFGVTSIVISHDIASCFRIAAPGHPARSRARSWRAARPTSSLDGENEVARDFIREVGRRRARRLGEAGATLTARPPRGLR